MKQTGVLIIAILALLVALGTGAAFYLTTQGNQKTESVIPSPSPMVTPTSIITPSVAPTTAIQPQPTETEETTGISNGWLTYKNEEYGFEISYPKNYQALNDEKNLYGWPKAVVLIYSGGQSYDLPIEVWDTAAEYESKYKNQLSDLIAEKVGDKYITLLNVNHQEEVNQIIATFKTIN